MTHFITVSTMCLLLNVYVLIFSRFFYGFFAMNKRQIFPMHFDSNFVILDVCVSFPYMLMHLMCSWSMKIYSYGVFDPFECVCMVNGWWCFVLTIQVFFYVCNDLKWNVSCWKCGWSWWKTLWCKQKFHYQLVKCWECTLTIWLPSIKKKWTKFSNYGYSSFKMEITQHELYLLGLICYQW
jgi:hypothetical protein